MSVKPSFIFSLLMLGVITQNLYGQNNENLDLVTKSIQKIVGEYTIGAKIKDSTAIYSYAIKINVLRNNDKQVVEVSINNPLALTFFEGLDELKKIN